MHPFPEGSRQPSHSLVIMCISLGSTVIFPKSETAMLSSCAGLLVQHNKSFFREIDFSVFRHLHVLTVMDKHFDDNDNVEK